MAKSNVRVEQLSGAMGAEVFGIDLSKPLGNADNELVREAFYEHVALFFPGQQLTPQAIQGFVGNFGVPIEHPILKPIDPDFPYVHEVRKEPEDVLNYGGEWHMDFTFKELPMAANSLYCREMPAQGGDTLFANMYAAYDALSDGLKALFDGVTALHAVSDNLKAEHAAVGNRKAVTISGEAWHPVYRTIPETGRKALYVYKAQTKRFEDMTEAESKPMIDWFEDHATRPEFQMRYRWRTDTFGIWDNRCCLHYALNDYPGERRVMHRMVALDTVRPA